MWLFDPEDLHFLAVNPAATSEFGYSHDEFLSMTIADLRAPEDLPSLTTMIKNIDNGFYYSGRWRLRRKSGDFILTDIRWRIVDFAGKKAVLTSIRDITQLEKLEAERELLLHREYEARLGAEIAAHHFKSLSEALPGCFLVLSPEDFVIEAVSDAFLDTTLTRREDIKGKRVFDVFPDQSPGQPSKHLDDDITSTIQDLTASLERVRNTGLTDILAAQRYPFNQSANDDDGFRERIWSITNTPVHGPDGAIVFIIHRIEDVTSLIVDDCDAGDKISGRTIRDFEDHRKVLALDIRLRSRELQLTNERLREQEANLRTAQRLMGLGVWKLDIASGRLTWSDNVYRICGVRADKFDPVFENYVELVHPDDRPAMVEEYEQFRDGSDPHFIFRHRIVRPDGQIAHVRGIGERAKTPTGIVLNGVIQDVSDIVAREEDLSQITTLIRIAGRAAKFGGWRVTLDPPTVTWTGQTARIHDEPKGFSPTFEDAISYYAPEYQPVVRDAFDACIRHGIPFDEVTRLVTAKGRNLWVRSIGEPEYNDANKVIAVRGAFQDISDVIVARDQTDRLSRQLAETLEHISDAFFTVDHEWRLSFMNGQAEKFLERRRDELTGKNIWEAFPEAKGTRFQEEYENAVATRKTSHFSEYYAPLRKWFDISAYPTPDGLAIYFRDTTTKRARNEQLRLLETAVSHLNDILLITEAEPVEGPDGPKIVYVNDAFVKRTGFTRDEAIGKTPRILQGPKTQRDELDRIGNALRHWQPVHAELINYTKSDEPFWLELDIVPLEDDHGIYTHWVAVERDITERRNAERELRLNEQRFRLVSQATNDVIWDWDLETNHIWWNDGLRTLFGYDPEKMETGLESWTKQIHPDDLERVLTSIKAVINGTGNKWQDEYRLVRADGTIRHVADRGFVIRNSRDKAVRMLGSVMDVTSQREIEMRLRQSQKLEAIGQLTGGIAHDFNNLLTVILGNAEMLAEQLTDPKLRALADISIGAAERGAELTNRLLAFARRQALKPERIDIGTHIDGLEPLLRRTLNENIDLEIVHKQHVWTAEIDPSLLETAVINLVINARDAMPDGGRLIIETGTITFDKDYLTANSDIMPGDYVTISVSDNGTGMSDDVVANAFEPFFTTKEVGKGSGLGLSMVYGFVRQSGGHAKIYSEPGKGTTIRLYFPRVDDLPSPAGKSRKIPTITGGDEHILIVEDDALVRENAVAMLRELGYRISFAENSERALDLLARYNDIALLFTDMVMPGSMDGLKLAEIATLLKPDLSVLYTSGYSESLIIRDGRFEKKVHMIGKPYRRQELAQKIRELLDQ